MMNAAEAFGAAMLVLWIGYEVHMLVTAVVNYMSSAEDERDALAERHRAIAERIQGDDT